MMRPSSVAENHRRGNRTKAVLPVRVKGKDSSGKPFEELAITLDVTMSGLRLGSVRQELKTGDEVSVFYRQRKMQFRVMWTKKLKGTSEFQVGLQSLTHDREAWVLGFAEFRSELAPVAISASGIA
jgi:PilZ domain